MRYLILLFFVWLSGQTAWCQTSTNPVRFQVTYQKTERTYVVWVVPSYSTPNQNNAGPTEKGATAQVTLSVPNDFLISDVQDIVGQWDKNPFKLGKGQPNQDWTGTDLDSTRAYYVIGKSPIEVDYGPFLPDTPVALFSFRGQNCEGPVQILDSQDSFIRSANQRYSLNVANSFYSRSGQPASVNQRPLEQFGGIEGTPAFCENKLEISPLSLVIPSNQVYSFSFLPSIRFNGAPVQADSVSVRLVSNPSTGSARVIANDRIEYTPLNGYVGSSSMPLEVCWVTDPSLCTVGQVNLQISDLTTEIFDLGISASVSSKKASVNDTLTYLIVVKNEGSISASNVSVGIALSANQSVISSQMNKGTFQSAIWSIPEILARDSAVMTTSVRILDDGQYHLKTELMLISTDIHSENDESSACGSVPIIVCQGDTVELSVASEYTNVKWYLNNALVGSQNLFSADGPGIYTVIASNGDCIADGTCPIEIIHELCCPNPIWIPSKTIKRKQL